MLTVSELLSDLDVRLLTGESATDVPVRWVHISEIEDPTPWLSGGEMIMTTGMAIPQGGEAQRSYLERLDDSGVACLALSEGLFVPPVTALLATAGERRAPEHVVCSPTLVVRESSLRPTRA